KAKTEGGHSQHGQRLIEKDSQTSLPGDDQGRQNNQAIANDHGFRRHFKSCQGGDGGSADAGQQIFNTQLALCGVAICFLMQPFVDPEINRDQQNNGKDAGIAEHLEEANKDASISASHRMRIEIGEKDVNKAAGKSNVTLSAEIGGSTFVAEFKQNQAKDA